MNVFTQRGVGGGGCVEIHEGSILTNETLAVRGAYCHGILPIVLGAERVRESETVVPGRLGLSLPATADLCPPPTHVFSLLLSFTSRAGTSVSPIFRL